MINRRLVELLGKNKIYIVYIVILNIILLFLSLAITSLFIYTLSFFFDISSLSNNISNMIIFSILSVLLVLIIRIILSIFVDRIINNFASKILIKLRSSLFNKLIKTSKMRVSEISQLGVEGIEQLNLYYTVYIPQFFYALIAPIILFIIFLFINYIVAIIFLICIPLIPLSIILMSKYAKKIFNVYWDKYIKMGGSFLDCLNGLKELKLFKASSLKGKELDDNNEEFRKITMKVLIMQLFSTTIMDLVAYGGSAIGIVVSLYCYYNNYLIDSFYLVIFIILVGAEFFLPLRSLGSAFHMAMNGETAGNKILDILNKENIVEGDIFLSSIDKVNLTNVSFSYKDDNPKLVLDNVSFSLRKNNLYGLVGLSGSGKSSLTKILTKDERIDEGIIKINDLDFDKIKLTSYYENICYISYDSYLFNDTILNNFKLIKEDISEEEIIKYLKMVKLDYLVKNNKEGINYKIKEDSSNLSGGEKQRLILAINLVKKRDFYIFDEATSSIDKESEDVIREIIYSLKKDSIILFISHSFKNIINADEIFFIDSSHRLISGKNDELIKKNDEYKKIYELQKEGGLL